MAKYSVAGWRTCSAQYSEYKRKQKVRWEELARQKEAERAEQERIALENARQAEERRVKHELQALRCKVIDTPQRYRRPNANGSLYFEGTNLRLMNPRTGQQFELSFEGLFGFAVEGDMIDVVLATVRKEFLNRDIPLPVLVINRERDGYHLVAANIAKHNDASLGGESQLIKDLLNYSTQELNIKFE